MGKYPTIPLRKTKARKDHRCDICSTTIRVDDYYYTQKDRFLQTLHSKKVCAKCYQQYGERVLTLKAAERKKQDDGTKKLDDFTS